MRCKHAPVNSTGEMALLRTRSDPRARVSRVRSFSAPSAKAPQAATRKDRREIKLASKSAIVILSSGAFRHRRSSEQVSRLSLHDAIAFERFSQARRRKDMLYF